MARKRSQLVDDELSAEECIARKICYICQQKPWVHWMNEYIGGSCADCQKEVEQFTSDFVTLYQATYPQNP